MTWLKLIFTMILSWYPFMCIHELGHIISAKINEGEVVEVMLVPWKFSQTIIAHSENPLFDAWSGPLFGVMLPLLLWLIFKGLKKENYYLSIFSGFCLLANGLYIGFGWIDKVGDTGDILKHGGSVTSMVVFGIVSSALGLYIWHQVLEKNKKGRTG